MRLLKVDLLASECLTREMHPTVKHCRPFFAAGTGLDAHCVSNSFDGVAETYFFLFDETGEPNAMRPAFSFACWFFLLLGPHGSHNSRGIYIVVKSGAT